MLALVSSSRGRYLPGHRGSAVRVPNGAVLSGGRTPGRHSEHRESGALLKSAADRNATLFKGQHIGIQTADKDRSNY